MKAVAATMTQREQSEQARARALVRFNGTMFHSLAAASLLETAVALQVNRLAQVFGPDGEHKLWLEHVWWPRRAEIGRQLRAYIEATWPEFDWNGASRDFQEAYQPLSALGGGRARAAREVLGLCVMEAQAALFYRALAKSADEPQLRALARLAASDHSEFFEHFRASFERRKRIDGVGFLSALRTVNAVCRSARDYDIAAAFHALGHNWTGDTVIQGLAYPDFRRRMMQLLRRHVELGFIERLLFRPWLENARASSAPQADPRAQGRWLVPAVQPAGA